MNDTASSEKVLFAATTRAFLDKETPLSRLRDWHAAGIAFEPAWWVRAAALGWAGLLVPEDLGGGSVSGNGVEDLALLTELTGRSVAPGPLHPVSTVLAGLVDAENRDEHAGTIEALVCGAVVGSWAVYEPGRPWRPHDPAVTATPAGSGYRIDGVKDRVEAGGHSGLLLVVARCGDRIGQFLVPTDAPGVRIEPEWSIDLVKQYARVHFDGVPVTAAAQVGGAGQAVALIDRQTQIAQLLQCAEVVGILDTVLALTLQWAADRYTFGRPLASYQALKHRFADMSMWVQAARAATAAAAADIAARSPHAGTSAAIAKSYLGEKAPPILQDCVQLHGGIGVTWEHDLHLYLRRVSLYRAMFGTPEEHNLAVFARAEGQDPSR